MGYSFRELIFKAGSARPALPDEEHLAHLGERPGLQPIQIHAAGHALAALIAAIPADGAGAGQVQARRPMPASMSPTSAPARRKRSSSQVYVSALRWRVRLALWFGQQFADASLDRGHLRQPPRLGAGAVDLRPTARRRADQ